MRPLLMIAALLALAACVASPTDLRAPRTEEEWREVNTYSIAVNRVKDALGRANPDICSPCAPVTGININVSSGIGAFSDGQAIYITMPMLRFLKNDHELALVLAHEWSHILLQHNARRGSSSVTSLELEADCVATVLLARAGYDPGLAADFYRRMQFTPNGISIAMFGAGDFPGWAERLDLVSRTGRSVAGRAIAPSSIRPLCKVPTA